MYFILHLRQYTHFKVFLLSSLMHIIIFLYNLYRMFYSLSTESILKAMQHTKIQEMWYKALQWKKRSFYRNYSNLHIYSFLLSHRFFPNFMYFSSLGLHTVRMCGKRSIFSGQFCIFSSHFFYLSLQSVKLRQNYIRVVKQNPLLRIYHQHK